MTEWIVAWIAVGGYAAIVALMLFENLFPPMPSELIMPLAGFAVWQGDLDMMGVILAGTLGSCLGAVPWYLGGRRLGAARVRRLAERHGRFLLLRGRDVDAVFAWFNRHGRAAVFLGRLAPGARTLISTPAGAVRMRLASFFLWTTLGSAIWTAALAFAGYALKENFRDVERVLDPLASIVLVTLVGGYIVRVARWKSAEPSGANDERVRRS